MFGTNYKKYVLGTLTLVYTLSLVDQGLITLLLEPIKEDLQLSDTQLGFLAGIAFGLVYATFGLPAARWADRYNRVSIAAVAIGLWGAAVMSCLFVATFVQLVMARVATAVGAAGCMPPTYSLVGDYFPTAAQRTRAMTLYMLANPISLLLSFSVGGWLNDLYGWRVTFLTIGIPALGVAVLTKMSISEPRALASGSADIAPPLPRMSTVLKVLWGKRSTRHLILGLTLLFTMGLGLSPWYAAFMLRSHGMSTAEVGVWFGLIFGLVGIVGASIGGYAAAHWFANNERAQMRFVAATIASLVPCFVCFLLLPQKLHSLFALVPLMLLFNAFYAPTFALLQRLVSDEIRATTLAAVMLLYNLIGMGVGPQIVGIVSDALMPIVGKDSLRYAMLIMSFMALWVAYHFWMVGRTVNEDLSAAAVAGPGATRRIGAQEVPT